MRHIKISNVVKIEAEISARAYKKLCEKLKGYNKQGLWKIMDHYIFHTMQDHHVEELLKILDTFEKTKSFEEPPAPVEGEVVAKQEEIVIAAVEEMEVPMPERRMEFTTPITAEDLENSKTKLDILYDVNYFTYLAPETAQANAKKLISYAESIDYPTPAHWHLIAVSADLLTGDED